MARARAGGRRVRVDEAYPVIPQARQIFLLEDEEDIAADFYSGQAARPRPGLTEERRGFRNN